MARTQTVTDWRKEWFEIADATYLKTAARAALPRVALHAVQTSIEANKAPHHVDDAVFFEAPSRIQASLSRMIGAKPEEIALTTGASTGAAAVAHFLRSEPGDEVVTAAEGKQAARSVAIELLATLQATIGDLNDLRRIVTLLVFVNSWPNVVETHVVANGASELFIEVFEERGAHARSAVGVLQIPFGCCVEIEMFVETFVSESACEL